MKEQLSLFEENINNISVNNLDISPIQINWHVTYVPINDLPATNQITTKFIQSNFQGLFTDEAIAHLPAEFFICLLHIAPIYIVSTKNGYNILNGKTTLYFLIIWLNKNAGYASRQKFKNIPVLKQKNNISYDILMIESSEALNKLMTIQTSSGISGEFYLQVTQNSILKKWFKPIGKNPLSAINKADQLHYAKKTCMKLLKNI